MSPQQCPQLVPVGQGASQCTFGMHAHRLNGLACAVDGVMYAYKSWYGVAFRHTSAGQSTGTSTQ
jgi:hypothetical protein